MWNHTKGSFIDHLRYYWCYSGVLVPQIPQAEAWKDHYETTIDVVVSSWFNRKIQVNLPGPLGSQSFYNWCSLVTWCSPTISRYQGWNPWSATDVPCLACKASGWEPRCKDWGMRTLSRWNWSTFRCLVSRICGVYLCYTISYQIILYHIISYHVILYHVILRYVVICYIIIILHHINLYHIYFYCIISLICIYIFTYIYLYIYIYMR